MRNIRKQAITWLFAILVILGLLFIPLPYYVEGPGSANNLQSFVTVKNHPDRYQGKFMLTSVSIAQATPALWLYAKIFPHYTVESKQLVTGGQNNQTYQKVQRFYMQGAINDAIITAYQAAHESYQQTYRGIYVLAVDKQSNFGKHLKVGDTITQIDGHHFKNAEGYQDYVAKQGVRHRVNVQYQRAGKSLKANGALIKLSNGRAGIGVALTNDISVKTKIPVRVDPGQIGGPSAGLMFSLQIYQQLTTHNLRHGRKIAGTGTVDGHGRVGEIGGIDKKIIAAKKAGASIFFAPYVKPTKAVLATEEDHQTNYQLAKATAKRYAPKMKVVPVTSFKEALNYLQSH